MSEQHLEDRVAAIWQTRRARALYRVLRVVVRAVGGAYLRTRMVGAERLRMEGAFIIAPVHRSNLDGPLVNARCPRTVRSLAKIEMFQGRAGTWISAMIGSFPVQRGAGDRRTMQAAIALLRRGEPLLVFPEGTRHSGRQVGEIFGGAAFLAARTGVPILPVGIAGTEEAMPPKAKFLRRVPVSIVVGEPLLPPETQNGRLSSDTRNEFTNRLRKAMQSAMDEAVALGSARRGRRRHRFTGAASLVAALALFGVILGGAGCAGESEAVLEVTSIAAGAAPDPAPTPVPAQTSPTPPPPALSPVPSAIIEAAPSAVPIEPTPAPDRSAQEFLDSLADEFHFVLAEEFEHLAAVSAAWNPDGQISMAVVLPDETLHGYQATESRISASAVKLLWAAAALDAAGVEAVRPSAHSALILSDNLAGGRLIDLAGGVDAVNNWTRNAARLRDTRLEAWRFQDPNRVAGGFQPENPLGNRTTMADLALFLVRLHKGELLGPDETSALEQWLLDTSHSLNSPRDLNGVLLDRLPPEVAESSLHKAGWLRPNCCPVEYRQMIDSGTIVLADGRWFALAIMSAWGEFYDLTNQWVALAACRIYAVVAEDRDIGCEREGDGVHDPEIWPEAGTTASPR